MKKAASQSKGPAGQSQEKLRQAQALSILAQTYQGSVSALRYENVFQLLIAVMLSAQTNDNQVNKITEKLFAAYPDAQALAALSPQELAPHISSCGLYNSKAKHIVATAQLLCQEYGGQVPSTKEQLTALPGVGGKTANVVLAQGFGIPALAVDTHVYRVARRLGLATASSVEGVEQQLCAIIPREQWAEAHHWLIWHGRRICAAQKPRCGDCPLGKLCPQQAEEP